MPVPIAASANNTIISASNGNSPAAIKDAGGNTWTIANGRVVVNGTADPTTGNVTHLAYVNGQVWQENTGDLWWSKATPASGWSPAYGTSTVPIPVAASANATVIGVTNGNSGVALTDASDNSWNIVNGQVTANGTVDPTTANVVELAYVNGEIWQENTAGLWWGKIAPADGWAPTYGTPANPIQGVAFTIGNDGNHQATTINVGEMTQSVSAPASGVKQLITTGIKVNGSTVQFTTIAQSTELVIDGNSTITHGAFDTLSGGTHTPSAASVQNNGTMTLNNGTFNVGSLTGAGSVVATNGSTINMSDSVSSETIQLVESHLNIQALPQFISVLSPISMGIGSGITLEGITATYANYDASSGDMRLWGADSGGNLPQAADLKITGATHVYAEEIPFAGNNVIPPSAGFSTHLSVIDGGHSLPPPPQA